MQSGTLSKVCRREDCGRACSASTTLAHPWQFQETMPFFFGERERETRPNVTNVHDSCNILMYLENELL